MTRIVETIEINAPPQIVFRALTTPSELLRWWGDPEICSSTAWEIEPKPGGSWRSRWRWASSGEEFEIKGKIIAIESPRVLEYSWHDDRFRDLLPTIVRYELVDIPGGTRVTVTHGGFAGETADFRDYSGGWSSVLASLRADTETLAAQTQGGAGARHRT